MQLRILGCSGGKYKSFNPTCFLLDDEILIDVGNVMSQLELEELQSLKAILLTHMHFDHIADLPFLIHTLFEERNEKFSIYSSRETKKRSI
ncbi:MAG: MBL fold metallo-hydrolase [Candidatus Dadabacteria bacterium]|nr:MBL fold metallo-hydrolase [Candidatus Dadabacteria bacterium]NIQ16020.1 MBL fold metallo-hydrolase [Candidatus Dadabacteria bacterium]